MGYHNNSYSLVIQLLDFLCKLFFKKVIHSLCRLVEEKNLRIFNISGSRKSYVDKDFWVSSPIDFVQLIRDAEFVVSNSFHATAFSLIFQREFCVVNRSEAINERMLSLLKQYGLQDRLVADNIDSLLTLIDYSKVQSKIERDIEVSKQYLRDIIG